MNLENYNKNDHVIAHKEGASKLNFPWMLGMVGV